MKDHLERIKGRCRIEDGHWIWTGAISAGYTNVWAPDYTSKGGESCAQRGPRAVWHVKNRRPIPQGYRVFSSCQEPMCINPGHVECIPCQEWGEKIAASGQWKGKIKRITANRKSGRARSRLSPEKVTLILASDKPGRQLSQEIDVSRSSISRLRTGQPTAFTPVGGLFSGLIAANSGRRAA